MASSGWFFLILVALLILAAVAWVVFTRIRAQRLGLPAPSLSSYNPFANRHRSSQPSSTTRSGGVIGWAKSKFDSLKGGSRGYGPAGLGGHSRGLDPDGAWDTRVGDEADYGQGGYYEEQELGLQHPGGSYAGGGYGPTNGHALPEYGTEEMERGRSRSRNEGFIGGGQGGLDERYDEEMGRHPRAENPFGDGAERSQLRGSSRPRVAELDAGGEGGGGGHGAKEDSPTERKSMFRENM